MPGHRLRSVLGLAATRLRHDRTRTILAILGITLAVLSTTLLGSLGVGVIDTGQQKFDAADRDLWISGGPTRISPGSLGGFEGGIVDAHEVSQSLNERETINTAAPLLFQTVYVGSDAESLETVVAVGATADGGFTYASGQGFGSDAGFYNDGAYNGTPNQNLVIGTRLQSQLDVGVDDQLHVGGTVVDARQTTYTVTGTSSTFTQFLGTPTVSLPLAELQMMTGKASTDQASLITVDVADDANVEAVAERLKTEYPAYTVRTNSEQLQAIVAERIVVVAAGIVLVGLAVLAGIALTVNLLTLLVLQEQDSLAAIRAVGVSRSVVVGLVATQGLCYGLLGAFVGLLLTLPASFVLNRLASRLVGFEGLVQVTTPVLAAGASIALVAGVSSALVAGWRAANIAPLETLER
jgi:putative ABC transport system permease protein